jgi:hypothetical protein
MSDDDSDTKQVKMKLAIVASLIAGADAFAPAQTGKASTALNMAFEDELGAQPPLGLAGQTLLSTTKWQQSKWNRPRQL